MKGILGRKIGMTQVFTTDGLLIPVTVVEATENVVLQKKTVEMCIRDSLSTRGPGWTYQWCTSCHASGTAG